MERSKGLILIVVGIAAALIVWQVGFKKTEEPTTSKKEIKENKETPSQPAAGTASQPGRFANNVQGEANLNDRNQGRGNNNLNRTAQTNIQNAGYKISIPTNISSAELQIIYAEYRQMTGGRNTGRTRGNRGTGMDMGGMMGGGMDMGGMMGGGMDMESMMEMMNGGFGGMGGRGGRGGMDMEGMDMGGNDQMNIDDSENNF